MSTAVQMTNTMTNTRDIGRVVQTPAPTPGFIGEGHTAVPVMSPADFASNDPFIVLMDDRIDLAPGRRAGEAHPHAGFEIATWVVEGELRDRDEGVLRAGDVMWTTAGSGVVHNEDVEPFGRTRILQLWMTLPAAARWSPPRFIHMPRASAPVREDAGVIAHVYSGSSGSIQAPYHTHLPLTMVDIQMEAHSEFLQDVPSSFNGFVYVLDGEVTIGTKTLTVGQVGWLDDASDAAALLRFATSGSAARVVFYAGERQGVPIVMHGPFVGETRADLMRVSQAYVRGELPRVSEL
jgi:redox-sensitive bicupin YhaK (pirin superfamily)